MVMKCREYSHSIWLCLFSKKTVQFNCNLQTKSVNLRRSLHWSAQSIFFFPHSIGSLHQNIASHQKHIITILYTHHILILAILVSNHKNHFQIKLAVGPKMQNIYKIIILEENKKCNVILILLCFISHK